MLELTLRPAVRMGNYVGVPYVVALGICDALPCAAIAWPHDVVDATSGELITSVRAQAGYDDDGMFVRVVLHLDHVAANDQAVARAVQARVEAWEHGPQVAPLAAVLADYANRLARLGDSVEVTYPNGRPYARGLFAGVDVWGRATVRLSSGEELEFAPEKYRMR